MLLKARSAGGLRRIPGTAPRPRRPFAGGIGAAPSPGGVDAHPWRSAPPRPVPERAGAPAGVPLSPLIRGRSPGGGASPAGSPERWGADYQLARRAPRWVPEWAEAAEIQSLSCLPRLFRGVGVNGGAENTHPLERLTALLSLVASYTMGATGCSSQRTTPGLPPRAMGR